MNQRASELPAAGTGSRVAAASVFAAVSLVGVLVAAAAAGMVWHRIASREKGVAAPSRERLGQPLRRIVPSAADIHVA